MVYNWQNSILVKSWPYHPLLIFINILETSPEEQDKIKCGKNIIPRNKNQVNWNLICGLHKTILLGWTFPDLPEAEIITSVLSFCYLVEQNGISLVSQTEKLMYLMTTFMGPDTKFMEKNIKLLIQRALHSLTSTSPSSGLSDQQLNSAAGQPILRSSLTPLFNFDVKLEGRKSFESLYFVFLDVFQSASYGDELFSVLVMVPLAQQYDVKWRKRVWSEYTAVLRFITCTKDQVSCRCEFKNSQPKNSF